MSSQPSPLARRQPDSLADVLERVLDKGVVIAGDIVVNVLDLELLSLKLRLFIASADTAREMGMDWWTTDPFFSSRAPQRIDGHGQREIGTGPRQLEDTADHDELERENADLRRQIAELRAAGGDRPLEREGRRRT